MSVLVFAPGTLPRTAPTLRFETAGAGFYPGPLFCGDTFVVTHDRKSDALWTHHDLSGAAVARAVPLGEQPEAWTVPVLSLDGTRLAALAYRTNIAIVFCQYDLRGGLLEEFPLPFDDERSGAFGDDAGPVMLPPRPLPGGGWLLSSAATTRDSSPYDNAVVLPGRQQPVWRRFGFVMAATERTALIAERGRGTAIDLATGREKWSCDVDDEFGAAGAGVFALSGDVTLRVLDEETGATRFTYVTPDRVYEIGVIPAGVLLHSQYDETVRLLAPADGRELVSRRVRGRLAASDGAQIAMFTDTGTLELSCGPIAEPGAWAWTLAPPVAGHTSGELAAREGWVAIADASGPAAWVYGP